jgi:hypothetical protein
MHAIWSSPHGRQGKATHHGVDNVVSFVSVSAVFYRREMASRSTTVLPMMLSKALFVGSRNDRPTRLFIGFFVPTTRPARAFFVDASVHASSDSYDR